MRLALAILLVSSAARADDPRFGVAAHLGLGTPLGFVGVQGDVAPVRWLAIEAGIGRGMEGVQLAVGAHVHVVKLGKRSALTFGANGSAGAYRWYEDLFFGGHGETEKLWRRAYWLNADVGIELGDRSGWYGRFCFGYSRILNPDSFRCAGDDVAHCMNDHADDGTSLRYGGMMLGRAI